jgi:hypothetical protein
MIFSAQCADQVEYRAALRQRRPIVSQPALGLPMRPGPPLVALYLSLLSSA